MPSVASDQISAVILAGGQSRRMNGRNKAFIELHGRPLIDWVIEKLRPQTACMFIAANPDDDRYRTLGIELLADTLTPNYGPLAGVLSCLERADTPYVFTAPCDTPFLPDTLVAQLYEYLQDTADARAVSVSDGMRVHGTLSLLDRALAGDLRAYLQGGGRQVRAWLESIGGLSIDFSAQADAFLNINSEGDFKHAESICRSMS